MQNEIMKKIGIITIARVNNYGAELQAFATQHSLQLMGYDAEIIDYLYFINPRHKKTKVSKPSFKMPLRLKAIIFIYPWLQRYKRLRQNKKTLERRERNFVTFHNENTKFSPEFLTADSLSSNKMDYDVYVVGSDQVWNPNNYTSLDPYFLKFAPQDKIRISYASSFGVSSLPKHSYDYYRKALRSLDAVSVREENAVQLVEKVSGIKAQWVLDPTLLLTGEEWKHYAKEVRGIPEFFVLIYEVTPCVYIKQLATKVAQELRCKVVRINCEATRQENDEEVINIMDAGPAEFVWLFSKASMIITNSFHGTAFSVNMQKAFFVVAPARKQNNSRQKSLLCLLGLDSRLLVEGVQAPAKEKYNIDYSIVTPRLELARETSKNFLKKAIDGNKRTTKSL